MDLEAVLREIAPGLLRYCRGRTGDGALAEEIAQEVLTVLVERYRRHDPPDSPRAFALALARRRAGRAVLRRRLRAPLDSLRKERAGHDPAPDPERRAIDRDRLARLHTALGELTGREREALLLAAGGLGATAAASLLGISPAAFKMRLSRARRHLARILESGAPSWGPRPELTDGTTR